jgi:hypothetical protein
VLATSFDESSSARRDSPCKGDRDQILFGPRALEPLSTHDSTEQRCRRPANQATHERPVLGKGQGLYAQVSDGRRRPGCGRTWGMKGRGYRRMGSGRRAWCDGRGLLRRVVGRAGAVDWSRRHINRHPIWVGDRGNGAEWVGRRGIVMRRYGRVGRRRGAVAGWRGGYVRGRRGAVVIGAARSGAVGGRSGAVRRRRGAVGGRSGAVGGRRGAVRGRRGSVGR